MKIKNYKKVKNNCYQIYFIDNQKEITLYDDIILKYNLLLKKEITEKELIEIQKENEKLNCYYKAIHYVTNKNRAKKEIKEYLKRNGFDYQQIENTITKLEEKNIINEENYIEAFVNDQLKLTANGPKKIKKKLMDLEFAEEKIEDYLAKIPDEIWHEKLKHSIIKKTKANKKEGSNKIKEKILFTFIREGFNKEEILSILEMINIPKNNQALEKEAEKLYNKLNKKYKEKELFFQIKGRLINKGFLYEDIEEVLEGIKKISIK